MQFVNHWNVMAAGLLFSKEKYLEMEIKKEKHSLENVHAVKLFYNFFSTFFKTFIKGRYLFI